MAHYSAESHVNVGSGSEVSILELAKLIAQVVGFSGQVITDPSKPDGTPRKLVDSRKLASLGWRPRIGLAEGLASTYAWFERAVADQAPELRMGEGESIGGARKLG